MKIYICFSLFRFVFGLEVNLFQKLSMATFNKYCSSVEFVMEKKHRLKVAPKNS